MNYQEFLDYIKENLPELMNAREMSKYESDEKKDKSAEDKPVIAYTAHLHQITKNNGIVLDGITLLNEGEMAGPNVYLNPYFESYQMGRPISAIMEEILICYEQAKQETVIDVADILNFDEVKERIIIRLVNYEKNREQLESCPHKRYLDLAVTFRYLASKDAMGLASSLIFNKEFSAWNIDLEDLYQLALFNTMREFPWQMESLVKVVSDCFGERLPKELREEFMEDIEKLNEVENRVNMYVLTNDAGLNGATCILYDNVIKNFAKVQECNVFILPSSVHEGATRFAA